MTAPAEDFTWPKPGVVVRPGPERDRIVTKLASLYMDDEMSILALSYRSGRSVTFVRSCLIEADVTFRPQGYNRN